MLTPDEYATVKDRLADRLSATGDIRGSITAIFTPDDADILRDLPTNLGRADEYAAIVVSACLDDGWTKPLSLMERLLVSLITAGAAALVPIRDRVRLRIDPNPDPLQTLWLQAAMPFFSRSLLRTHVRSLLNRNAQPILRILGPEACGKSYTRELLDHIAAEARPDLHVVYEHVPHGSAPSYRVEDLAEALVAPTTRDIVTLPPRSTSNYPRALCRWVLNAAMQTPGKWVYVLDGFHQTDPSDPTVNLLQAETLSLLQALALDIAGGDYRKRIRLVLVDYPAVLPSVQPAKILREDVPPAAALSEADLVACLSAHYKDVAARNGNGQPAVSELQKVAKGLLDSAPLGPTRLESLNLTLTSLRTADLP